jgi:hypothetical protein
VPNDRYLVTSIRPIEVRLICSHDHFLAWRPNNLTIFKIVESAVAARYIGFDTQWAAHLGIETRILGGDQAADSGRIFAQMMGICGDALA